MGNFSLTRYDRVSLATHNMLKTYIYIEQPEKLTQTLKTPYSICGSLHAAHILLSTTSHYPSERSCEHPRCCQLPVEVYSDTDIKDVSDGGH
jgi:hypothetical protein